MNLRIDDETTYSLRVSWQSVDFRNIRHYRLRYIGEGDRQEETVRWAKLIQRGPQPVLISEKCSLSVQRVSVVSKRRLVIAMLLTLCVAF